MTNWQTIQSSFQRRRAASVLWMSWGAQKLLWYQIHLHYSRVYSIGWFMPYNRFWRTESGPWEWIHPSNCTFQGHKGAFYALKKWDKNVITWRIDASRWNWRGATSWRSTCKMQTSNSRRTVEPKEEKRPDTQQQSKALLSFPRLKNETCSKELARRPAWELPPVPTHLLLQQTPRLGTRGGSLQRCCSWSWQSGSVWTSSALQRKENTDIYVFATCMHACYSYLKRKDLLTCQLKLRQRGTAHCLERALGLRRVRERRKDTSISGSSSTVSFVYSFSLNNKS